MNSEQAPGFDKRIETGAIETSSRSPRQVLSFLNDDLRERARQIGGKDQKEAVYTTMLDKLAGVEDSVDPTHGWGSKYGAIKHSVEEGLTVLQQKPSGKKRKFPPVVEGYRAKRFLRKTPEKIHKVLPFRLLGCSQEEAEKIVEQVVPSSWRERLGNNAKDVALSAAKVVLLDGSAVIGAAVAANTDAVQWLSNNGVNINSIEAIAISYLIYAGALGVFSARPDAELLERYGTCSTPSSIILHKLWEAADLEEAKKGVRTTSATGTFTEALGYEIFLGPGIWGLAELVAKKGAAGVVSANICASLGLGIRTAVQEITFKAAEKFQEKNISSREELVGFLSEEVRGRKNAILNRLHRVRDTDRREEQ